MRLRNLLPLILVICAASAFAQDDLRILLYDGPVHGVDNAKVVLVDNLQNIYVTGNSYSANKEDYLTIKYNQYGQLVWTARYDGPGHDLDKSNAMVVDAAGNVYVTGTSMENNVVNSEDYLTIKYNAAGVQQWASRYDSPFDCNYSLDIAYAIDVDASGNVYVTGGSVNGSTSEDMLTLKYNSAGALQWAVRFNGVSSKEDEGKCLKVDPYGNVIVAGKSFRDNFGYDYQVIKYNSSNGAVIWQKKYSGPGNGDDIINAMTLDQGGNVYVTGSSKGSSGNLDYATIKYLNATGDSAWVSRFNGPANMNDEASSLVLDPYGALYVTGYTQTSATNTDYMTIKYDGLGQMVWSQRFNAAANGIDKASAIGLRKLPCRTVTDVPCYTFDIYVTGQSQGSGSGYDYSTVKYNQDGVFQWEKRFNGIANNDDIPVSMALLDKAEFIYITGTSNNDYATLWYVPSFAGPNGKLAVTPTDFRLEQNYPNPFNPSTNISFALPAASQVKVSIYNALGELVENLFEGSLEAGYHSLNWNAAGFNSGVYFYKLEAGNFTDTKKMVLIK